MQWTVLRSVAPVGPTGLSTSCCSAAHKVFGDGLCGFFSMHSPVPT